VSAEDRIENPFPGPVVVTDVLDLHGFFPEQVPEVLGEFIRNAARMRLKTLRIIHGKGRSRLKYETLRFLGDCKDVARAYDAPPESGGWGATVVEMRPSSPDSA
jgi:DNA-nicking Smr family endonuclease